MNASGLIRHFLINPLPKAEWTLRRRSTSFSKASATWNKPSTLALVVGATLIYENDYLVTIFDLFDARFRNLELETDGRNSINFWSAFTMAVICVSENGTNSKCEFTSYSKPNFFLNNFFSQKIIKLLRARNAKEMIN